jgi:hypothetical protein
MQELSEVQKLTLDLLRFQEAHNDQLRIDPTHEVALAMLDRDIKRAKLVLELSMGKNYEQR